MNKPSGCRAGLSTTVRSPFKSQLSFQQRSTRKLIPQIQQEKKNPKNNYWITKRLRGTDRDVGPEELIVPEQRAHVFHAALLLHAVTDVRLEPGAKLDTQARRQRY